MRPCPPPIIHASTKGDIAHLLSYIHILKETSLNSNKVHEYRFEVHQVSWLNIYWRCIKYGSELDMYIWKTSDDNRCIIYLKYFINSSKDNRSCKIWCLNLWNSTSHLWLEYCMVVSFDMPEIIYVSFVLARLVLVLTTKHKRFSFTSVLGCHAKSGFLKGPPADLARESATKRAPGFHLQIS